MNKTAVVIGIFCLLISATSSSGPIAVTFRDGVFGVPWGASADEIEAKLPGGKWKSIAGGIRYYSVRDGRTILGVARKAKNELGFGLSSNGRFSSVSISFPTDGETYVGLMAKTQEQFGANQQSKDSVLNSEAVASAAFNQSWPDDEGLRVNLSRSIVGFSSFLSLYIQNTTITESKPTGF